MSKITRLADGFGAPQRIVVRRMAKAGAGPFIGPRGGKWADSAHTVPWKDPAKKDGRVKPKGELAESVAERVRPAMSKRGLSVSVEWSTGNDGKVSITKDARSVGHLIVENGKVKIPRSLMDAAGHGKERLRSHPEYPKPIQSQFILDIEQALGDMLAKPMAKGHPTFRLMAKGQAAPNMLDCGRPGIDTINEHNTIEDISNAGPNVSGEIIEGSFRIRSFQFDYRRSPSGIGILSVSGGNLVMPYHMVCKSWKAAKAKAPDIVKTFLAGRVPEEGVFRVK